MHKERTQEIILVVDDEPGILASIGDLLEDAFDVHTCSSGEEALEILRDVRIAAILCDQRMPGMNGDEFLAMARELSQATRILITGYADLKAVVRAVNRGQIYAYVSKPWEPQQLKTLVDRAVEHYELLQELQYEKNLLHTLMDNSTDAIFFKDAQRRYLRANLEAARLNGLDDPAAMIGCRTDELGKLSPDVAKAVGEQDERVLTSATAIRDEVKRVDFPDGTLRWYSTSKAPVIDPANKVTGIVAIARDVTERLRAEAQVATLARFYSENPNPTLRLDDGGAILSANEAAAELLEIWGVEVGQASPPEISALVGDILAENLRQQIEVEGEQKVFRLDFVPVVEEGYVNVYGEDVTAQKKTEAKLRQVHKMEAIGQLTGGVAHDFNNRLTVMLGNLELLEERLGGNEGALNLVKGARRAAEGGAKLTRQLLTFARRQVLEPEVIDINALLGNLHDMLVRTLGVTIEIMLELEQSPWPVYTDAGQLEDAILNLAVNARDAMPDGGTLTIETVNVDLSGAKLPSRQYMAPGEYLMIALTDTGKGIPEAIRERVFDPFFTTKETGKGTGLGLAMVYGFAKQSKGYVNLYSEEGHGTCVKLYLPRHEGAPVTLAPGTGRIAAESEKPTETLLVVEDDPGVRKLAVTLLTDLGYRVNEAQNGVEALEVIRQGEEIDLLFTDIVMPGGLTGFELAKQVRGHRPGVKVVYTSGYTEKGPHNGAIKGEKVYWLTKPYTRAKLARKLREALGHD